jgi:hypothetical protein
MAGRRGGVDERSGWIVLPEAQDAVLAAVEQWWRALPGTIASAVSIGARGAVPIGLGEDVLNRVRSEVSPGGHGRDVLLSSVSATAFRAVSASSAGGVVLVVGSDEMPEDQWRAELTTFIQLLHSLADAVVHGCVLRGWDVIGTLSGRGLATDWPVRAEAATPSQIGEIFEDMFAPDAFGVQLLGQTYADRIPTASGWRATRVGAGSTLLEHAEPAAWFSAPFVPQGKRLAPKERPVPALLRQARDELAPLLVAGP